MRRETNFDRAAMLEWIRQILALGIRRPGYPGGLRTEQHLASRFEELGLREVHLEPVPVHCWRPSETRLTLAGRGEIPCFPIPYTAWTPPAGVAAPCVHLGEGDRDAFERGEVRGRIAIVETRFGDLAGATLKAGAHFIHDPEETIPDGSLHPATWLITNFGAYHEAQRRGAVAFIGVLVDHSVDGCEFYVPYDGYLKDLPAVWVGREWAARLRESSSLGAEAELVSRGDLSTVDSHNVVGTVPGIGEENIILTCHHDAPFASAVEDASGLAVLLALAREFAPRAGELRRSLHFVASSGHFHGGVGNRQFVERHRKGLLLKTVVVLGIEHIAREARGGADGYELTGHPEVRALFVDANPRLLEILERGIRRWELSRTLAVGAYHFGPEPPCDSAPFFTAGIPSVCHISGPIYLFDPHDTIDKVMDRDLTRVAGLFADTLLEVDRVGAADLEEGLTRRRGDPPAPPPPWFLPPEAFPTL